MSWNQEYQRVSITKDKEFCKSCGSNILDIGNISYSGEAVNEPSFREELCECRSCGTKFVIRYDLFNPDGHIYSRVFSGDINNPEYNWQDILTDGQKKKLGNHLESCKVCSDKLSEEILSDAWFASVVHRHKNQ